MDLMRLVDHGWGIRTARGANSARHGLRIEVGGNANLVRRFDGRTFLQHVLKIHIDPLVFVRTLRQPSKLEGTYKRIVQRYGSEWRVHSPLHIPSVAVANTDLIVVDIGAEPDARLRHVF
jgi:hypothetical protein